MKAGLRAHHRTPRRARRARAWARPAGGHGSAKAFGRCFSEIGFRLDLAPGKNRFRFGHKRAGPKTKAKLPNRTARDGVAASALDGRAHPHACRARRGVPWRPRRHAFSGTHERTFLKSAGARASDARQARGLSDRCVPPAGARGHAARARRVRRAHRRRGRLRQGARPSEPHARRASRHAQHRPRRSALA